MPVIFPFIPFPVFEETSHISRQLRQYKQTKVIHLVYINQNNNHLDKAFTTLRIMTSLTISSTKPEFERENVSAEWAGNDTSTLNSANSDASTLTNNSAYPEPSYTSTNVPSNKDFHILDVTNTKLVDLVLSPSNDTCLPDIYVSNYIWAFGKYSVTLHHGSKYDHILGVLKLAPFSSGNLVGVGDPNVDEGKDMVRGSLDRTSKWMHSTYEFGWDGGRFTWLRTRVSAFSDQQDLELRENVEGDAGGGTELKAEVLAIYRSIQGRGCTG